MKEFGLKSMWRSPNGTIRNILNGLSLFYKKKKRTCFAAEYEYLSSIALLLFISSSLQVFWALQFSVLFFNITFNIF